MDKMGKEFTQEHIMKICLPPELYLAVIKFSGAKGTRQIPRWTASNNQSRISGTANHQRSVREIPVSILTQS
jgi:hypothetical protein